MYENKATLISRRDCHQVVVRNFIYLSFFLSLLTFSIVGPRLLSSNVVLIEKRERW